ncbi:MAG: disulfide bond formation protein DsbA [Verrucomicrobia bacterium]|nr:disulfide bond formation protein DsbA [Verrucomicrobiota bacterium]
MNQTAPVRLTYFLEIVSSWCWWAEPAWAELQSRYAGQVEFTWKIALMDASGMPTSREQCDWFYRRSGVLTRSPYILNSGWYEPGVAEYLAPNCVAEAARGLGITDDRARLAIAAAAVRAGKKVSGWDVSVAAACEATGLDPAVLLPRAKSPEVEAICRASTAEFHSLRVSQRPTFVAESRIGDRAVLSGTWQAAPIAAVLDSMLADAAGYASYAAHIGGPPAH